MRFRRLLGKTGSNHLSKIVDLDPGNAQTDKVVKYPIQVQLIVAQQLRYEPLRFNSTETKKDDSLEIEEDRHDISAGATMSMTEMGSGGNTRGKPRSTSTRTKSRLYARTRSWHLLTQSQHKDGTKTAER